MPETYPLAEEEALPAAMEPVFEPGQQAPLPAGPVTDEMLPAEPQTMRIPDEMLPMPRERLAEQAPVAAPSAESPEDQRNRAIGIPPGWRVLGGIRNFRGGYELPVTYNVRAPTGEQFHLSQAGYNDFLQQARTGFRRPNQDMSTWGPQDIEREASRIFNAHRQDLRATGRPLTATGELIERGRIRRQVQMQAMQAALFAQQNQRRAGTGPGEVRPMTEEGFRHHVDAVEKAMRQTAALPIGVTPGSAQDTRPAWARLDESDPSWQAELRRRLDLRRELSQQYVHGQPQRPAPPERQGGESFTDYAARIIRGASNVDRLQPSAQGSLVSAPPPATGVFPGLLHQAPAGPPAQVFANMAQNVRGMSLPEERRTELGGLVNRAHEIFTRYGSRQAMPTAERREYEQAETQLEIAGKESLRTRIDGSQLSSENKRIVGGFLDQMISLLRASGGVGYMTPRQRELYEGHRVTIRRLLTQVGM